MLETLPFVIALAALVIALFWIILRSSSVKIEAQYRRLAKHLGLEAEVPGPKLAGFVRNEPTLYGHHRGREVSVSAPGKGLQNTRQIETVLKIELRDKTLSAQFAPAGLIGSFSQRDSRKKARWQSGDAKFDAVIDVRSDAGERLQNLLSAEDRRWLAQTLKKHTASIYIGGGTLAYAKLGLIANDAIREHFEAATEFLCNFAETVEAEEGLVA